MHCVGFVFHLCTHRFKVFSVAGCAEEGGNRLWSCTSDLLMQKVCANETVLFSGTEKINDSECFLTCLVAKTFFTKLKRKSFATSGFKIFMFQPS